MFGNVTALEGLHVTGKYRDRSMQHTCSRHAAWDPHRLGVTTSTPHPTTHALSPTPHTLPTPDNLNPTPNPFDKDPA